ncbi:hypothetical protein E3U55_04255 [Filobacillus milosensis]|uniref:Alkaline phosphatase family protein n=1 Tax=Filobacillus milosensis TaxID=94137 RepID=A0A4Y8IQS6_9BACI|nr:alkaline phosphatase family protein [Filobacillus milosensis]TFB24032.1 hypothetical protein E3U55_04255 [Filobacillus milosensis]
MKYNKPVILLNIDSLMTEPLLLAIKKNKAPAIKFLMNHGTFIPNMVSSFPTMSVTIDSSLLTGTYPDQHKIPGLNWFNGNKKQKINYGTGFRETIGIGFSDSVINMFDRLNNEDLSKGVTTIFEDLAKYQITSSSINSFVYRGNNIKNLIVPKFIQTITNVDETITTQSPELFSLGAFASVRNNSFAPFLIGGNRKYAGRELRYLIKNQLIPGFTFCIFQDMDIRVHVKGPYDISGISKIDKEIQKTLNLYDSWEQAIEQNIWMVIGDNGQSPTGWNPKKVLIDLRKTYSNYNIHNIKHKVEAHNELLISVNQRMAYIYALKKDLSLSSVAEKAQSDDRIDVIAWKEGSIINVISGKKEGRLKFKKKGPYYDEYKQTWTLEGNYEILDLNIKGHNINYNDFPDALARIYGSLHSHEGRFIIVNAKPGHEFLAQKTPFHIGGACHGSLHKQESLIPFICTGTDTEVNPSRIIDLKELIINQLINNN